MSLGVELEWVEVEAREATGDVGTDECTAVTEARVGMERITPSGGGPSSIESVRERGPCSDPGGAGVDPVDRSPAS